MKTERINTTIDGIRCIVKVEISPAMKGSRDSLCGIANAGPPLEPDDPGGWEIVDIYDENSNLLPELFDKLEDIYIMNKLAEDIERGLHEAAYDAYWMDI